MSCKFDGFPPGKTQLVRLPVAFFTELMPTIDDPDELKLTLFCFWALNQREGEYRYLRRADFDVSESPFDDVERLEGALTAAIQRGTVLAAEVEGVNGPETLYFLNTAKGRAAVGLIEKGHWRPGDADQPLELLPERPNIFELYEQNIGALTPVIADELRDAAETYPEVWIREAITVAVLRNARSWRYVSAVLERWYKEGRDDGPQSARPATRSRAGNGLAGADSEASRRRYLSSSLADE